MPKLTRADWRRLRKDYHVAFPGMNDKLFDKLLDKIYAGETEGNPGDLDDIDALMVCLSHSEPPIPPMK